MNRWGPAGSWPSPSTGSVRPFSRRRLASLVAGSALVADLRQHPIVRQTYVVPLTPSLRSARPYNSSTQVMNLSHDEWSVLFEFMAGPLPSPHRFVIQRL